MMLTKEYNDKIKSGKIKTHRRNCICHSDKFNKVTNYDRHGLWQPVVICKECGLIQSNPQLLDEEYAAFYSSDLYAKIWIRSD